MANRYFTQFNYSLHKFPVLIDCNVAIGATGAVGTLKGPGVTSVTRLAAGTYQVKLQDNYFKYFAGFCSIDSPVSGSNVTAGSFSVGTVYQITALGTTDWQVAGLPVGLTAAVGMSFKAAAIGSGTGTAKIMGPSGIVAFEVIGNPDLELGPSSANQGGYITVRCYGATDASTTTLVATDPADGSKLRMAFWLSNSSVVVQGE